MKIKKFQAKSMPEAMQQIRKELGSNAVILQSKEVKKGGVFGLFKNKRIEVVAALDAAPPPEVTEKKQPAPMPKRKQPIASTPHQTNNEAVLSEIKYMKELLEQQAMTANSELPPLYETMRQYLLKQEVTETITEKLLQQVQDETVGEITTKAQMQQAVERVLTDELNKCKFDGLEKEKQIIQFVGPTGVGKTTTLAKVAAKKMLEEKKSVALITMDTYRIAAIDQLKTYARILDVPIEVAYTLDDYTFALEKFQAYDLIFVDTAGRNFRNPQYIRELEQTVMIDKGRVETILVLSLTAKAEDTIDIYKQFEPVGIEHVIFTKLDETLTYGSIFNICIGEAKKVMYVTNGQNVPDDLMEPTVLELQELLLSRYDHG